MNALAGPVSSDTPHVVLTARSRAANWDLASRTARAALMLPFKFPPFPWHSGSLEWFAESDVLSARRETASVPLGRRRTVMHLFDLLRSKRAKSAGRVGWSY